MAAAQNNPQAMRDLKENYPEFATAIESYVSHSTQAIRDEFANRPAAPAGITEAQLDLRLRQNTLETLHPGWQQDCAKPEFIGWMKTDANVWIATLDEVADHLKEPKPAIPRGLSWSSVRRIRRSPGHPAPLPLRRAED